MKEYTEKEIEALEKLERLEGLDDIGAVMRCCGRTVARRLLVDERLQVIIRAHRSGIDAKRGQLVRYWARTADVIAYRDSLPTVAEMRPARRSGHVGNVRNVRKVSGSAQKLAR